MNFDASLVALRPRILYAFGKAEEIGDLRRKGDWFERGDVEDLDEKSLPAIRDNYLEMIADTARKAISEKSGNQLSDAVGEIARCANNLHQVQAAIDKMLIADRT